MEMECKKAEMGRNPIVRAENEEVQHCTDPESRQGGIGLNGCGDQYFGGKIGTASTAYLSHFGHPYPST